VNQQEREAWVGKEATHLRELYDVLGDVARLTGVPVETIIALRQCALLSDLCHRFDTLKPDPALEAKRRELADRALQALKDGEEWRPPA
jgi:hypothetical protein